MKAPGTIPAGEFKGNRSRSRKRGPGGRAAHKISGPVGSGDLLLGIQRQYVEEKLLEVAMGQAAATIAHELRQPLSAIQNLSCYLRQTVSSSDPSICDNLKLLEQQAELAGRILSNLVAFARSGKTERTSVNVHTVLDDVLRRICWRREISLEKQLAARLPRVSADSLHIDRILSNLITNALESMEGAGTLSIVTGTAEGSVIVEITDTGCGISPEQEKSIFRAFVTTKRNGTGLGLPLCRQLARANGGVITFTSRPGKGSTFQLRLACASKATAQRPRTPKSPSYGPDDPSL
jgi:signal transduction histidine kinase